MPLNDYIDAFNFHFGGTFFECIFLAIIFKYQHKWRSKLKEYTYTHNLSDRTFRIQVKNYRLVEVWELTESSTHTLHNVVCAILRKSKVKWYYLPRHSFPKTWHYLQELIFTFDDFTE